MKYRVEYAPSSLGQLAACYLAAQKDGRGGAVTAAAETVDSLLAGDPSQQGESREGAKRVIVEWPLSFEFEVEESDRAVVVLGVRYSPGKRTR